jgi:hypothetical protein
MDELTRGATRSGEVNRAFSHRYYASFAELKRAHKRIFGPPTVYLCGKRLSRRRRRRHSSSFSPFFAERPSGTRKHALSETIIRIPDDHPDPRGVLVKAFAKLFSLYTSEGEKPPSFDCTITANLSLFSPKRGTYGCYFGQDFSNAEGRLPLALTTSYRVDSLSDVSKIPVAVPVEEFGDAFLRTYSDTQTVVHSIIAIVFVVEKILTDYSKEKVTKKTGYNRLF